MEYVFAEERRARDEGARKVTGGDWTLTRRCSSPAQSARRDVRAQLPVSSRQQPVTYCAEL